MKGGPGSGFIPWMVLDKDDNWLDTIIPEFKATKDEKFCGPTEVFNKVSGNLSVDRCMENLRIALSSCKFSPFLLSSSLVCLADTFPTVQLVIPTPVHYLSTSTFHFCPQKSFHINTTRFPPLNPANQKMCQVGSLDNPKEQSISRNTRLLFIRIACNGKSLLWRHKHNYLRCVS